MATLKIRDLSVGDWVAIDHEDYGWQVAQINVCGDLGIGAYFKDIDPEEEYDCTLSQVRPIPITPEILEANGFIKWQGGLVLMGDEVSCRYEGNDLTIEQSYRDNEGALVERLLVNIECLFVHQLQHALRLAGVDKEIIMPKK